MCMFSSTCSTTMAISSFKISILLQTCNLSTVYKLYIQQGYTAADITIYTYFIISIKRDNRTFHMKQTGSFKQRFYKIYMLKFYKYLLPWTGRSTFFLYYLLSFAILLFKL